MSDNKSARMVNAIPATQSLDFARRIRLWSGGLTSTAQSITIPWANLKGIDVLDLYFQQMGSDAGNGYTGGASLLVSSITTAVKENLLPISLLDGVSTRYMATGRYSYQHSGDNLIIKWVAKGWWDLPAMTWNNANTMDNGLSMVRVEGYQSFNLQDVYLKSEITELFRNRFPVNSVIEIYGTQTPSTLGHNGTWLCIASSYGGPTGANGHLVASRSGAIPDGFPTAYAQASITGSNIGFWAFKLVEVTTYPNSGWYTVGQATVSPATTLTLTAYNLTKGASCTAQLYTDGAIILDKNLVSVNDVIISGSGPGVTPYANETNRWRRIA